jgi:hypothetical protein
MEWNNQKTERVANLLSHPPSWENTPPQANLSGARVILESSFLVGVTLRVKSCIYQLSPRCGIGSRHHPYASFKWTILKVYQNQGGKLEFPMHKHHHKLYHHPNSEIRPFCHPGLPVHTHLPKPPSRCENSNSSHLSCPKQEVNTRGR